MPIKGSNIEIQPCLSVCLSVCTLSFFCLRVTRVPASEHELPDRHITANKTLTKHPLLMHERLFDPAGTFLGTAVITVPQTTHNKMLPIRLEKSRKWSRSNQPRAPQCTSQRGGTIQSCHSSAKQSCGPIFFFFYSLCHLCQIWKFDKKNKITKNQWISQHLFPPASSTDSLHCYWISHNSDGRLYFLFFCTAAKATS